MNPYPIAARVDYENYRRPRIEKNVTCHAPSNDGILLGRGRVRMKGMFKNTSLGCVLFFSVWSQHISSYADTVFLSTYNVDSILNFNSTGIQSTFATAANGLNYPAGLAFDGSGNLYVANTGGGLQGSPSIEKFSSSGTGSVFTTSGLSYPADLAFDENGNLYVANAGNNTVEEFNSSGTGSVFATATSGLDSPFGLAFDSSGNLYVANYSNTILKFTPSGTGTVFATSGLDNPQALAFDSSGNLYVANYGNNTIEKFNASGIGSTFVLHERVGAVPSGTNWSRFRQQRRPVCRRPPVRVDSRNRSCGEHVSIRIGTVRGGLSCHRDSRAVLSSPPRPRPRSFRFPLIPNSTRGLSRAARGPRPLPPSGVAASSLTPSPPPLTMAVSWERRAR